MRHPSKALTNPGAAATATIYDEGNKGGEVTAPKATDLQMFRLSLFADQIINVRHSVQAPGATNFRNVGTDTPSTASTHLLYERNLVPGRNRFQLVTTTGPTTFEASYELIDRAIK